MFRVTGKFALGFTVCAAVTLALFFVARLLFLTRVQTPQSDPHYEVRYAGVSSEMMLGVVSILPLLIGILFAVFYRRAISKHVTIATAVLALPLGFGLVTVFYTIVSDTLWLGMD